ncbi:hypothetical protein CF165_09200 [Amycolatopsis vastitatis]|uniref:Uncharacterized protein n=2 Tax=Amycolatopsis vastitatis TaxID=1905142 RepID=A0A229TEI5_9PSEU|nr:hypothetical protein CF165_09200 [Amycolatopsis vastitatis]
MDGGPQTVLGKARAAKLVVSANEPKHPYRVELTMEDPNVRLVAIVDATDRDTAVRDGSLRAAQFIAKGHWITHFDVCPLDEADELPTPRQEGQS